jgi:hypothetical protein
VPLQYFLFQFALLNGRPSHVVVFAVLWSRSYLVPSSNFMFAGQHNFLVTEKYRAGVVALPKRRRKPNPASSIAVYCTS